MDVHQLTFWPFVITVNALGDQNLIEPIICHLQYKAPVYHTVTGFEASVYDAAVVQVLHSLMTVWGKRLSNTAM